MSLNVTGPQGVQNVDPCALLGNKPLSHKESMTNVKAWFAVGMNEIHSLLIVPSKPKGLAEGKGHSAEGRQRNTLL